AKTRGPKLAEQLREVKKSLNPLRFPEQEGKP
ncbi:RpiR family carbohydrate utilization transcriptional regulator, partial [Halomonas ventosae]